MATRIVQDNRAAVLRDIETRADLILQEGAFDIEGRAKVASPIDTGFLRAGIGARRAGHLRWQVIVIASYAFWVEFGTTRRKATPFLLPSYNFVKPVILKALQRLGF